VSGWRWVVDADRAYWLRPLHTCATWWDSHPVIYSSNMSVNIIVVYLQMSVPPLACLAAPSCLCLSDVILQHYPASLIVQSIADPPLCNPPLSTSCSPSSPCVITLESVPRSSPSCPRLSFHPSVHHNALSLSHPMPYPSLSKLLPKSECCSSPVHALFSFSALVVVLWDCALAFQVQ
jgi:hypothetical protein